MLDIFLLILPLSFEPTVSTDAIGYRIGCLRKAIERFGFSPSQRSPWIPAEPQNRRRSSHPPSPPFRLRLYYAPEEANLLVCEPIDQRVRRRDRPGRMAGGHGPSTTYKGVTLHHAKRWHALTGKGMCAMMWVGVIRGRGMMTTLMIMGMNMRLHTEADGDAGKTSRMVVYTS
ncbi:hypothetical protein Taro_014540 [Colocasia esculenta]|uniref:Uncharacterized protein n=1 Tax=Colocasia esculenta TaxID=4460 RepID=A0A843UJM7_COLES|nr:hypothetical protein [Colocasia esculenta]